MWAKPTLLTVRTSLCYSRDNSRWITEISRYLSFIVCHEWVNHKHVLHSKMANATDGKIPVNSVREILHIYILFLNTNLFGTIVNFLQVWVWYITRAHLYTLLFAVTQTPWTVPPNAIFVGKGWTICSGQGAISRNSMCVASRTERLDNLPELSSLTTAITEACFERKVLQGPHRPDCWAKRWRMLVLENCPNPAEYCVNEN